MQVKSLPWEESHAGFVLAQCGRAARLSTVLTRQALPLGQMCVIPFCEEKACGRCLNRSPGRFLCEKHINSVHAGGRSLHHPEVWKVSWRFMENNLLQSPFQLCCETRFYVDVVLRFNCRDILLFFLTTVYITSTQLLHLMKFLLKFNIHYVSKTCPIFIRACTLQKLIFLRYFSFSWEEQWPLISYHCFQHRQESINVIIIVIIITIIIIIIEEYKYAHTVVFVFV